MSSTRLDDPPPSYDSLFGRVRNVGEQILESIQRLNASDEHVQYSPINASPHPDDNTASLHYTISVHSLNSDEFTRKCCDLTSREWLIALIGFFLYFGAHATFITMIVFGSLHFEKCPGEPFIPICLIINGSLASFILCLLTYNSLKDEASTAISVCVRGLKLCLLGWFIAWSVLIFRNYNRYGDEEYCNNTIHLFSLIMVILGFVFIGLVMLIKGCIKVCCDDESEVCDEDDPCNACWTLP